MTQETLKIVLNKSNFYNDIIKLCNNLEKGFYIKFINIYGEYSGILPSNPFNLELYKKKENVIVERKCNFGYLNFYHETLLKKDHIITQNDNEFFFCYIKCNTKIKCRYNKPNRRFILKG